MTTIFNIFYGDDVYEVVCRDSTIVHIVKYCGSEPQDVVFEITPSKVKREIIISIKPNDEKSIH